MIGPLLCCITHCYFKICSKLFFPLCVLQTVFLIYLSDFPTLNFSSNNCFCYSCVVSPLAVRSTFPFFSYCFPCRFIRSRVHFHSLRSEKFSTLFFDNTRSNNFSYSPSTFVSRTALESRTKPFYKQFFGPIVLAINRFFSFCGA